MTRIRTKPNHPVHRMNLHTHTQQGTVRCRTPMPHPVEMARQVKRHNPSRTIPKQQCQPMPSAPATPLPRPLCHASTHHKVTRGPLSSLAPPPPSCTPPYPSAPPTRHPACPPNAPAQEDQRRAVPRDGPRRAVDGEPPQPRPRRDGAPQARDGADEVHHPAAGVVDRAHPEQRRRGQRRQPAAGVPHLRTARTIQPSRQEGKKGRWQRCHRPGRA